MDFTGKTAFKLYDIRTERTIAEWVLEVGERPEREATVRRGGWIQKGPEPQEPRWVRYLERGAAE